MVYGDCVCWETRRDWRVADHFIILRIPKSARQTLFVLTGNMHVNAVMHGVEAEAAFAIGHHDPA